MKTVWWLALLALAHGPAAALNKCTDAAGQTTYQDAPCAATQKKVEMEWDPKRSTNVLAPAARLTIEHVEPNAALKGPAEAGALLGLYRRWIDAEELAGSTARIALSGPVSQLQALRRETEALQVPPCVADAQMRLRELVAKSVDVHLSFMQKREVGAMLYQTIDRDQLVRGFEASIQTAQCRA